MKPMPSVADLARRSASRPPSRLGTRYGEALSAQRAVLRNAISEWRGHEMGTEGDSFFVVFESATDAVACCVAAQRALSGHAWPGGAAVRVRMGLHSGEPSRHEDGYIGMDVHRAARIAATAHGSQVVMSSVTWELAHAGLPAELSVRDLGFHRLKDIGWPAPRRRSGRQRACPSQRTTRRCSRISLPPHARP